MREGDALVFHSIGSVGEGLAVPACTVEVIFEPKRIPEALIPPELWVACIPDYWIGKKVFLEYADKDVHQLGQSGGVFSAESHEYVAMLHGADEEVVQVAIEPLEHGRLPRNAGFRWGHITEMKLMEDQ